MKTFNKTFLPDQIQYNGKMYKYNSEATQQHESGGKLSGHNIQVNVLSKTLRGREDLHGKPYKANVFIYSAI